MKCTIAQPNQTLAIACWLALFWGATNSSWLFGETAKKPNVVFILADDLGWSDTTLYGTTKFYRTPNIERLAQRGMTFSRAYSSSPLCSPTRASVLTGLSPARIGITTPNCHLPTVTLQATIGEKAAADTKAILPNSVSRLKTEYYTLAEMFRDHGYATAHLGKWHLGAPPYSPLEHGFDIDVPHWPGPGPAGSYVAPWKFPDFDPDTPDQHIEDRMAQEAESFIEQHCDQPFFLNYWMFSVHAPFNAKQALIDEYKQRADPLAGQRSPTYAAMIESMDDAVGRLLDTLDRLELADNTIIVFASDNGGNMYNEVDGGTATNNAPLRGGKATMYEGGVRGPAIVVAPGEVAPASRSEAIIQSSDYYPTLLDLLGIEPQPGQIFDGMSIVPALHGKPLDREVIFTYFPHNPPVPEWLPASVSVHSGDWKLIRIFFGGESGQHRFKLFNLSDDIGEERDLVEQFPERVQQLNSLIDNFLDKTAAVLPAINPKFDPSKYHPELEGKAKLKQSSKEKSKAANDPQASNANTSPSKLSQPVAGWQAAGTCDLEVKDGVLIVNSNGGDPHLSFTLPVPIADSPLVLHLSMASSASGKAQVFWHEQLVSPAFHRDRSTTFNVDHDQSAHDYLVEFAPQSSVVAVRIDPCSGPGEVKILKMQLSTTNGRTLHTWTF